METLEIQGWLARGQELLDRCRSVLAGSPDERVRALARRLPSKPYDEEQELRVVFAGQYNAGKSTILRVLTGREDILIGPGVPSQSKSWTGTASRCWIRQACILLPTRTMMPLPMKPSRGQTCWFSSSLMNCSTVSWGNISVAWRLTAGKATK